MSEPLNMRTSLPGLPDVEIWLNVDWIIVKYGELISYRYAHELGPEERDAMRVALAQATA